jgi:hypothetical protein
MERMKMLASLASGSEGTHLAHVKLRKICLHVIQDII